MQYCTISRVYDNVNSQIFERVDGIHISINPEWEANRVLFILDVNSIYSVRDEIANSRHTVPAIEVMKQIAVTKILQFANGLILFAQSKSSDGYAAIRDDINLAADNFVEWVNSQDRTKLDLYEFDPEAFAATAGIVWPS